jgi:hypothetical protein
LALFLLLVTRSIASGYHAANRFEWRSDPDMATLARSVMLALGGSLTASFFLSNVDDRRTWILIALGPTLLAITQTKEQQQQ